MVSPRARVLMIWIFSASLVFQLIAVGLAVRLNWIYRHHRAWWLISLALFLFTAYRATHIDLYLKMSSPSARVITSELVGLNVSVLLVVGVWLLAPLFRTIQEAEEIVAKQQAEMNQMIADNAIEVGTQIGERIKAEQAQRNLNAMYHSLVETLPMSIIRKDRAGRFVFVNSEACRMLDRTREEVVGKTDSDLFEPLLAKKYQHDDQKVLDTGEMLEDIEVFRDPQGELRQVQILKTPVYDSQDDIVGTQVIFWDVTERRQAIEALARNESIKSAMFEAALDCIITIDDADHILEFNSAAARAFGYTRKEVVGQEMANLLIPEHARERHRENLEQYLDSGVAGSLLFRRLSVPMQRKDGSLFTAELSMQPIPLDNSTGFTVFLRDITERELAEKELAEHRNLIEQANADLQLEVQERRRAELESEMRNRDLKTLLYVISHDLREPVRAVRNFGNLIHDRHRDNLDEKGQDFLARIIGGAERLDRQLEDVLMLSRAQRLIDPHEQVALNDVVADVLKQLELKIQETRAQISVDQELPTVFADRSWTVQAVLNLVSNALKFTNPNAAPEIAITGFEKNGAEIPQRGIVVADRGPGIASKHAERIFDLFQRGVGREIEGTGAGLSIVRRIAERHGGQAWCQPRKGGGTEFWLGFGERPEH